MLADVICTLNLDLINNITQDLPDDEQMLEFCLSRMQSNWQGDVVENYHKTLEFVPKIEEVAISTFINKLVDQLSSKIMKRP